MVGLDAAERVVNASGHRRPGSLGRVARSPRSASEPICTRQLAHQGIPLGAGLFGSLQVSEVVGLLELPVELDQPAPVCIARPAVDDVARTPGTPGRPGAAVGDGVAPAARSSTCIS